jgi:aminoglycoside phosphotransferase (APT) family kinase protein
VTTTEYDAAALEAFLSRELGEDVVRTRVLHRALNLSIEISTADDDHAYVLRKPDKLRDTDLVNDLRNEYEVMEWLAEPPIHAPEPVLYCDDESVLGAPFFLMTHLAGESLSVGDQLPERFREPASRERVGHQLIDALAAVHTADAERFDGVCEQRTAREQVQQDVERLEMATEALGRERPVLWSVAEWLAEHAPPESERALVHGDFKPGNVFFAGGDHPELTGVVDWETALLGDPRQELGYFLLYWQDRDDPTPTVANLSGDYSDEADLEYVADLSERGLCPFTTKDGAPSRRDLVDRYEDQTSLAFEHDRFYRAHAAFGLATVWEDIDRHRMAAGADPGEGAIVEYMGRVAKRIIDGEIDL